VLKKIFWSKKKKCVCSILYYAGRSLIINCISSLIVLIIIISNVNIIESSWQILPGTWVVWWGNYFLLRCWCWDLWNWRSRTCHFETIASTGDGWNRLRILPSGSRRHEWLRRLWFCSPSFEVLMSHGKYTVSAALFGCSWCCPVFNIERVCSALYMVRETSAKFCQHASNVVFNT
jgi:hypothetical protein